MSLLNDTSHGRALVRELRKRKLTVKHEVREIAEDIAGSWKDRQAPLRDWAATAASEVAGRYETLCSERMRACEALGWRPSKSLLLTATTVMDLLGVNRKQLEALITPVAEDVNPHYKSASPMRLYDPRDVLRVRGRDAVLAQQDDASMSSMDTMLGREYCRVGTLQPSAPRSPFDIDPDQVDRSNQAHATTQDAVADFLREHGITPRSPSGSEPDFDLAWEHASSVYVAEVKSLTSENQEKQLRLGLGQVLRYRYALRHASRPTVIAVLVTEHEPSDNTWLDLCEELGVILAWPPFAVLAGLLPVAGRGGVEQ